MILSTPYLPVSTHYLPVSTHYLHLAYHLSPGGGDRVVPVRGGVHPLSHLLHPARLPAEGPRALSSQRHRGTVQTSTSVLQGSAMQCFFYNEYNLQRTNTSTSSRWQRRCLWAGSPSSMSSDSWQPRRSHSKSHLALLKIILTNNINTYLLNDFGLSFYPIHCQSLNIVSTKLCFLPSAIHSFMNECLFLLQNPCLLQHQSNISLAILTNVIPRFVKGAMNIIDLLGILPYFMSLVLSLVFTGGSGDDQGFGQSEMRRIAQIFRIMRILRCLIYYVCACLHHYLHNIYTLSKKKVSSHYVLCTLSTPIYAGSSSWHATSLGCRPWA